MIKKILQNIKLSEKVILLGFIIVLPLILSVITKSVIASYAISTILYLIYKISK